MQTRGILGPVGGSRVSEVPRLSVVKKSKPSHAIFLAWGAGVRFPNALAECSN